MSSPASASLSQSTSLTTPDVSPSAAIAAAAADNDNDDIWASDSDIPASYPHGSGPRHEMLSDLPSIRRQHITSGYREGLSIGKAQVIQSGFDEGYPIGFEIALRAGKVLGVLEGMVTALKNGGRDSGGGKEGKVSEKESNVDANAYAEVNALYLRAKTELDVRELLRGVSDEVISTAKDPSGLERVETTLRKWEGMVLGIEQGAADEGTKVIEERSSQEQAVEA